MTVHPLVAVAAVSAPVSPSCRSCGTPVTPGHTGHDGPLVDGEETFWCEDCCPHCTNERRRK